VCNHNETSCSECSSGKKYSNPLRAPSIFSLLANERVEAAIFWAIEATELFIFFFRSFVDRVDISHTQDNQSEVIAIFIVCAKMRVRLTSFSLPSAGIMYVF
jgi:hypothetical protein